MNTKSVPNGSRRNLKIVVIGGTGLIGTKLVKNLRELGHEVVATSSKSGVNAVTGEGLAEALEGAQVVVDVMNSPSFDDDAVMEFFRKSTRNLLTVEAAAGVDHHVALSVVGADRVSDSGYLRAKLAQENLITAAKVPHTIVRATQFFEFVPSIAYVATEGQTVRLPPAFMQPIAADDVAAALTRVVIEAPLNGVVEIAGPETIRQDHFVQKFLRATGDARQVVSDPKARYFGAELDDQSLMPGAKPQLGVTRFGDWLGRTCGYYPGSAARSS